MILPCDFEELSALKRGARVVLGDARLGTSAVAAPPESRAQVEALVPLLGGALSMETLAKQRFLQAAVDAIVEGLREDMEARVIDLHPAHEGAVGAYFDFAHALSVQSRLRDLGAEMVAMIEVVTGRPPDDRTASSFQFPD